MDGGARQEVISTNLLYSRGWKTRTVSQKVEAKAAVSSAARAPPPRSSERIEFYIVGFNGVIRNIDCWLLGGARVHRVHSFSLQSQNPETLLSKLQKHIHVDATCCVVVSYSRI